MKCKTILTILFLLSVTHPIFSQGTTKCKEIVENTFQAIDEHSPEKLFSYLAEDFTIAGQKGEIAKKVLKQLISQLTINSYEEQKIIDDEETKKFIYSVDYNGLGVKQSVFTFNKNCELKALELFQMEVKVLKEGETKIDKPSDNIIKIPFKMTGNLIAVQVFLNGQERTFLLDSGSPRVALNSKYISTEKEQNTISSAKGVTDNTISGMNIQKGVNLNFGGIQINNQKVVTIDLSHLEESLNTNIYGLIGYEMIKDYDLLIDYENQVLTLIKPNFFDTFRKNNLGGADFKKVPIKMRGHIPVLEVQIGKQNLNFGIDTGAESNLIKNTLFANLQEHLNKVRTDNLWGADKSSVEVKSGTIDKMFINGKTFRNLETVFTDINHLNKDKEMKIQGLIGFPILSKQKTIISFKREEILFEE